ncbi:3-dehydroquinate dehydratase type I [Parasponia andersonii]|uniref:3-dehydroquinate dehydratase type I n=1 Tax=Parasponia andersonii TaxID=3476 RepID=A0A2P5BGB0_PARAD|nr:3-dehydroquinate dehydratase type I [Parasponia andersonii]
MDSPNIAIVSGGGLQVGSQGMIRNSTIVCAPIMAESVDKMVIEIGRAKDSGAELVEIRLESLKVFDPHQDLQTLIKGSTLPTLLTSSYISVSWHQSLYRDLLELPLRKSQHGLLYTFLDQHGRVVGTKNTRQDALRLTMEFGADYIDVELQVAREFNDCIEGKKPEKFKVIVSSHNYQSTLSVEDLGNLVEQIQAARANIVKFSTTALDITDVARVFQIIEHSQVPIIGLVMGERGLISRIICTNFGGCLTFGTLESGIVSAPGQHTINDLLHLYNFRQIGSDTKVLGIIGKLVGHSKSPLLYNEAFKSVGLNGVFLHLLVDDIANFFQTYSSTDFAGFSVTIPHKEAALNCCDKIDPVANSIGAVNCIIRRQIDGKLLRFNTDYVPAISAIEDGLQGSPTASRTSSSPLAGKLFVVIGAGGAGKALAYGAKEKVARVVIANRTYGSVLFMLADFDRARELANTIGGDALSLADLDNFHPEDGMILANTTSVGMHPKVDETPISKHALRSYSLVFDAVYTPKITRLLREAEESGATIVTGLEMFIGQAYGQFEKFTGLPAPKELFRKVMASHS